MKKPIATFLIITLGCSAILAILIWLALPLDPLLSWLLSINLVTFLTYGYDKQIAGTGRIRVPERVLLILALACGSPAAWVGMRAFHHKTAKQSFTTRFWLVVLMQVLLVGAYFVFIR